jgi:rubrerythrin
MPKTDDNLQEAFAGESQANRKYLAWAKKADQEGHKRAAKLFRAVAEAETVHAHNHLNAMGGVKSTRENLEAALAGEIFEFENMYPHMIAEAKDETRSSAERSFIYANEVEKLHAGLYRKVLAELRKNIETDADFFVCGVCGYTLENEPPDECPVCKSKKVAFRRID